ncbi:MAG: glycine betaine ABC transporter substrate-binding protein [Pseudomonadota bacterium]
MSSTQRHPQRRAQPHRSRRRPLIRQLLWLLWAMSAAAAAAAADGSRVVVGSKNFNESYLLAEIMAQRLEAEGFAVERRFGFGGTLLAYGALEGGDVDVYPEYTGTVAQAILKVEDLSVASDLNALNARLAERGHQLLRPFGFDNTYAIALKESLAQQRGLTRISDLRGVTDLRLVFSHEFLERLDGWPGLATHYGLDQRPTGIEHALAYQAIEENVIDVTDAYSTDGELVRYGLRSLIDDRAFFPDYRALPIVSREMPDPVRQTLESLAGRLTEDRMQSLNAQVVFEQQTFAAVARSFLQDEGLITATAADPVNAWQAQMLRNTLQHLKLTGIALGLAVALALAISLGSFRRRKLAAALLYVCSLLQTIPSIALLALLLPVFGIGVVPAIVALLLYALLPIVRNALAALTTVDATLVRVAEALGLTPLQQLRHLYLPMALPSILAGIRTAAVICIGTATLAAFIGAGGLGDPIVTGLSLNKPALILQGAVPAAVLAVVTELVFEAFERVVLPPHRRGA